MNDFISRQAAIDKFKPWLEVRSYGWGELNMLRAVINELENLPTVQPERLTDDDFETIRIHLNAYKENLCNQHRWKEAEEYQRIIDRFMAFAPAQPNHNAEVSKMEIILCKDCDWWTKQPDSAQGRCALSGTYPTGAWFCANARKRGEADGND